MLVNKLGLVWKTSLSRPVVSVIKPRICVDVVEENVARVSDVYATLPPTLKLTEVETSGWFVVRSKLLLTSTVLEEAISRTADAVVVISRPLILVAVAAPIEGAVNVGAVRVLFVRTCVSFSVTKRLSTDPSQDLQYPPALYHCN